MTKSSKHEDSQLYHPLHRAQASLAQPPRLTVMCPWVAHSLSSSILNWPSSPGTHQAGQLPCPSMKNGTLQIFISQVVTVRNKEPSSTPPGDRESGTRVFLDTYIFREMFPRPVRKTFLVNDADQKLIQALKKKLMIGRLKTTSKM